MKKDENNISFESLFNLLKVHNYLFFIFFSIIFIFFIFLNSYVLKKNVRGMKQIYVQVNTYYSDKNPSGDFLNYSDKIPSGDFLNLLHNDVVSGLFFETLNQKIPFEIKVESQFWNIKNDNQLLKITVKNNFINKQDFKKINEILLDGISDFLDNRLKIYKFNYENECRNLNKVFLLNLYLDIKKNNFDVKSIDIIKKMSDTIFLDKTINYNVEIINHYLNEINFFQFKKKNDIFLVSEMSIPKINNCLNHLIKIKDLKNTDIFFFKTTADSDLESLNLDLISIILISFFLSLFLFFAYFFIYKQKI